MSIIINGVFEIKLVITAYYKFLMTRFIVVFFLLFLSPSLLFSRSSQYDVSYIWDDSLTNVLDYQIQLEEQMGERASVRRSQVGSGQRSEKIRTYNFKENRVTDHRIGLTVHALPAVLDGDLQEIHDALIADDIARQLAAGV